MYHTAHRLGHDPNEYFIPNRHQNIKAHHLPSCSEEKLAKIFLDTCEADLVVKVLKFLPSISLFSFLP